MKATLPILLCALPLTIALRPAQDGIDLTPRFEAGQTYNITQTYSMSGDIDEVSATVDGQEILEGGIEGGMEATGSMEMVETVKEVREGKISKMVVKLEDATADVTGSVNAMGNAQDIDESMDNPAVGHSVEITVDEEGEITRKDVTEDVEPLAAEELVQVPHNNHFSFLLPTEAVEEGTPFSLEPDLDALMGDMMSAMDSSEMGAEEQAMAETMMKAFMDATDIDATGTVTKVEEGIATIEYELVMTTTIADLLSLVAQATPDAEMPPGAQASLEISANMTGVGRFNLAKGYMQGVEFTGEFQMDASGSMEQGQQMNASAALSGEFSFGSTIELQ